MPSLPAGGLRGAIGLGHHGAGRGTLAFKQPLASQVLEQAISSGLFFWAQHVGLLPGFGHQGAQGLPHAALHRVRLLATCQGVEEVIFIVRVHEALSGSEMALFGAAVLQAEFFHALEHVAATFCSSTFGGAEEF